MGEDATGVQNEDHLARLIGLVVPLIIPGDRPLGDDLVLPVHVRDHLHGLDCARRVEGHGLIVRFHEFPAVAPDLMNKAL